MPTTIMGKSMSDCHSIAPTRGRVKSVVVTSDSEGELHIHVCQRRRRASMMGKAGGGAGGGVGGAWRITAGGDGGIKVKFMV
jgi:hypothetical protein